MLLLAACAAPRHPLDVDPATVAQRRMQTRRFDTADEIRVLRASGALLQDLGFTMDNSDARVGVLVASKDRSAVEVGDVLVSILLRSSWDSKQKLRASIVTRPVGSRSLAVRATFQRLVWNTDGRVTRLEGLNEPEFYVEFFEKLSKALFLEAHEL